MNNNTGSEFDAETDSKSNPGARFYSIDVTRPDGSSISLSTFRHQVLLIVNTASECVFTPQLRGLQDLYTSFAGEGFQVLAFPSDQFGHQEPLADKDITPFCATRFGVTYPVFAKTLVKGDGAHPLFRFLCHEKPGLFGTEMIKWNFTKFLVNREGCVIGRYGPQTPPALIRANIQRALASETKARVEF